MAGRGRTNLLSGLQQQSFGAELDASGDCPGVAARWMAGGEQFRLAVCLVGRDAPFASFIAESHFDVVQRSPRVALQQVQPSPVQQQVDVVQAKAAVAGDFEAGFEGGVGALQARRAGNMPAQGNALGNALGNDVVFAVRSPFRASAALSSEDPGRCPGLICLALSGPTARASACWASTRQDQQRTSMLPCDNRVAALTRPTR